jgi:hypothetical protein
MHSNKISANLQNDILKVLRGETISKTELPTAIMKAAKQASIDLGHAFLDEGYLSAERRRDILRRNLAEGLKKCGCTPTTEMINRYEEEASKPVQVDAKKEVAEETKKEEVVDEAVVTETEEETLTESKAKVTQTKDGRYFFEYPGMSATTRAGLMLWVREVFGTNDKTYTSANTKKAYDTLAKHADGINAWMKKNNFGSFANGTHPNYKHLIGYYLKNLKGVNIKGKYDVKNDLGAGKTLKKEEVVDEAASDMMLRSWIRNNYPSADNTKFNKILAAMQKQYNKDPKGYTYGGGFSKVAKDAGIK